MSNDITKVINGDCCIGCGLCGYIEPKNVKIYLANNGTIQAKISDKIKNYDILDEVCPFTNKGPNENELSSEIFDENCHKDSHIGYYKKLFIGHVVDADIREKTTSGGIITWLACKMLEDNIVDAVIHVRPNDKDDSELLYKYGISKNKNEVLSGAKSRYYPVELSDVMNYVRDNDLRYLLIGLPCFIKGYRRLCKHDDIIASRIKFSIGLVCGHLKSKAFSELFASQLGIKHNEIKEFDFRVKLPDRSAGGYGVKATTYNKNIIRPASELFGSDWGLHLFRYSACDCCDDVFAENADIVIGDAWLPDYINDWLGNSIVVVRNSLILNIIENGIKSGDLSLDTSKPKIISNSQSGGIRDRREDILWRLKLREYQGDWAPKKRNFGNVTPNARRKKIIETRMNLRKTSLLLWHSEEIQRNHKNLIHALAKLTNTLKKQIDTPTVRMIRRTKKIISIISSKLNGKRI